MEEEKFKYLLVCTEDLVGELLYYDRKECEEVSPEDCNSLTLEQREKIIEVFKNAMIKDMGEK